MSIDYHQNGEMKTVVKINLTSEELHTSGGHWSSTPVSKVDGDNTQHQIFQCVNVGSSVCGPEGWVKYEASDGSVFSLHFDCPISSSNVCDGSVSDNSPFTISSYVPPHYANIDYSWTITQKEYNRLLDVPVSSLDLLKAPKCNLVPFQEILKYIDGQEKINLKYVFSINKLHPEAKLWCAKHPLFLTTQSKAVLTRELAAKANNNVNSVHNVASLFESAMEYNHKISQGDILNSSGSELRSQFKKMTDSALSAANVKHEDVLLCTMEALCNNDLEAGWTSAVDSYINYRNESGLKERRDEVIKMIEDKL